MSNAEISKGSLISGDDLASEYKLRRKQFLEQSIPTDAQVPNGWDVIREFKTVKRIQKEKTIGKQLEEKVWRLFYELGCSTISSSDFTLVIRSKGNTQKNRQIDVLAVDEDFVFVVECKTKEELGKKRLNKDISEIANTKKSVENSIRRLLNSRTLKFIHVICTENIIWDENDKIDAKESGLFIWDEYDLLALTELSSLAGEGAKYQIYNRIFFGRKIKGFEVKIPALEARMGGHTYYMFVLSPEDLLKIAFVHHRAGGSNFLEVSDSYQRMIKKSRVRRIQEFIEQGGFFPGSIIVNFYKPLLKKEILGDKKHIDQLRPNVRPVAISLPPYYGCAWIVDGQHRLYGYADTLKKYSETIPVVAFVREESSIEAKMFVDINKNQKAIEANLLWDLYEDLYVDSEDENEAQLYAISKIAKLLNSMEASPFRGHIAIPKEQNIGNLTLTTICSSIYRQRLISPNEGLLFNESIQETINYAFERISAFFEFLRKELEDEWNLGDRHYIRTNSGFVVLTGILRDLVECNLSKKELKDLTKFRAATSRFLEPLVIHFLYCDQETIRTYRGAGGAGQRTRQVRYELTKVLRDANIGFRSVWLEKFEDSLKEENRYAKRRQGVKYYLEKDESDILEFKGSLGLNLDRFCFGDGKLEVSSKLPDEGVLKSIVAFLNSKGGDVLVGILESNKYKDVLEDKFGDCPLYGSKIIYGIDPEYGKDEWDGYFQKLVSLVENRISPDVLDSELIEIKKLAYEVKDLCLISVRPADSKQYLNNRFYIRRGNKTVLLEGSEIDHYWSSKKY